MKFDKIFFPFLFVSLTISIEAIGNEVIGNQNPIVQETGGDVIIHYGTLINNSGLSFEENNENIIQTLPSDLSCKSIRHLELATEWTNEYDIERRSEDEDVWRYAGARLSGKMSNLYCDYLTEGMDVEVLKVRPLSVDFPSDYVYKSVLVKLPSGQTTYLVRNKLRDSVKIKKEDKDKVMEVQAILANLGYDVGDIDGVFGSKTSEAIKKWQADNDYPVDGKLSSLVIVDKN